jgi:hypothetical protein
MCRWVMSHGFDLAPCGKEPTLQSEIMPYGPCLSDWQDEYCSMTHGFVWKLNTYTVPMDHVPSKYRGFPIGVPLNHPIHFIITIIVIIVRCSMINSDKQSILVLRTLGDMPRSKVSSDVNEVHSGSGEVMRHGLNQLKVTPKKMVVLSGMSLSMMIKGPCIMVLIIIFFYHRSSQCHPLD